MRCPPVEKVRRRDQLCDDLAGRRENEGWGTKSAWTKTLDFRPSRLRPMAEIELSGALRVCSLVCFVSVFVFLLVGVGFCWFLLVWVLVYRVGAGITCRWWFHVDVPLRQTPPSAGPSVGPLQISVFFSSPSCENTGGLQAAGACNETREAQTRS